MKFYDKKNRRLVYISSKADNNYWDNLWSNEKDLKQAIQRKFDPYIVKTTKKYLQSGDSILEGGCGIGQNIFLLNYHGFNTVGVDYAQKTVNKVKNCMPELNIMFGDVTSLPFEDNSFDGYWSFGVIEHFYYGYSEIMSEMDRVLKPDGILFMTVPTMSLLRKIKARLGGYPLWNKGLAEPDNFYQFALSPDSVIKEYENNGFELLEIKQLAGFKGLKDEMPIFKKGMQYIFDSKFLLNRVLKVLIGRIFERFSGHVTLYIFKNK
jgi:SAM-dependent methyltransferase